MTTPAPETKQTPAPGPLGGAVGGAVGGSAVGLGIGLSLGNGQLPLQTFQWIIDRGSQGLLLVVASLLLYLYLSERKARDVEKEKLYKERDDDKEKLYRELIDTVGPVREALHHASTALDENNRLLKERSDGGSQ